MHRRIWYFAYGSNMKESRLHKRDVPTFDHKVGHIENYAFRYNKIGVDDTGKGNIIEKQGSKTRGVFFKIHLSDYLHLHERYEVGYRQIEIEGSSNKKLIRAKSFIALPENVEDQMIPSPEYQDIVIVGAREKGLPEEYIQYIENER